MGELVLLNIDRTLNEVGSVNTDSLVSFAKQFIEIVATPGDRLTGVLNVYGAPEASTTVLGIHADSAAVQRLLQKAGSSGVFDSVQEDGNVSDATLHCLTYTSNDQQSRVFVGIDDELVWIGLGPDAKNGLVKAILASTDQARGGIPIEAQVHVPRLFSMLSIANTPVSKADNGSGWAKFRME